MKPSFIFLFVFSFSTGLVAQNGSVKIFLESGKDTTFTINQVVDYGLISSDNTTIHFRVIDSLHTKSHELTNQIVELGKWFKLSKNEQSYSIVVDKKYLPKRSIRSVTQPLNYDSNNYYFGSLPSCRYGYSLIATTGLSENSVFKTGFALGKIINSPVETDWSFYFGLGRKSELSKTTDVFFILNYWILLNYEEARGDKNVQKSTLGLEFMIRSKIYKEFYLFSSSIFFPKSSFLPNDKNFIISLGIGSTL